MLLPPGSHAARLCYQASLGDNGEVTAACFKPHEGTDERPADRYLSVHWLEYFGRGELSPLLQSLREFLAASTIPRERHPTRNGRLAVLACDAVVAAAHANAIAEVQFRHEPRVQNAASGISLAPDGTVSIGVDRDAAALAGLPLDPHSGIHTVPLEAAHELAFMDLLVSNVVRVEPGKT
jgi:hypothetical protein